MPQSKRGGARVGAGRKPLQDKPFETLINARVSQQQKQRFTELGGAQWLRQCLEKAPELGLMAVQARTHVKVPMTQTTVQAGFPSPAEDYQTDTVDFNEMLIHHQASTFVLRASGESMNRAGIMSGDLLVIDRSRTPKNGDIVIMQINNEFTVKRLVKTAQSLYLKAESDNPIYEDIYPNETDEWLTFGVLTHIIKSI